MTEEEAIALLPTDHGDPEAGHSKADDVLVKFLRSLGYNRLADAWDAIEKWYA